MAAKAQFQLFPSPEKTKKNPFRTIPGREEPKSKSSADSEAGDSPKSGLQTESVIIKIIEDTKTDTIQPRPPIQANGSKPEPTPRQTAHSQGQSAQPSSAAGQSSRPHKKVSLRLDTRQQETPVSPPEGLPINSIFPQYNPQLPLDQQAYFPQGRGPHNQTQQSSSPAGRAVNTSHVPPSDADAVHGPKTVPASVLNFPIEDLSPRLEYSTAEELLTLWESANGQELPESLGTFNLRMERYALSSFVTAYIITLTLSQQN